MPRKLRVAFPAGTLPPEGAPTWVNDLVPWTWTNIPSSTFSDYMKNDGTGIAPAHGAPVHVNDNAQYRHLWADSGPVYSASNHELYLWGGGHSGTSSNILVRWNLNQNSPDMEVCVQPTPRATRAAEVDQQNQPNDVPPNSTYQDANGGYYSDGNPYAFHSFMSVNFLDATDDLMTTVMAFGNSAVKGGITWFPAPGWHRGDATWRADGYWPDWPPQLKIDGNAADQCITFMSYARDAVYTMGGTGRPMMKLDATTRTYTAIGGGHSFTNSSVGFVEPTNTKALLVNLATGVETPLTETGDGYPQPGEVYPSNSEGVFYRTRDCDYVEVLGGWVGVYVDGQITNTSTTKNIRYFLFTEVDSTTVLSTEITTLMLGTPPGSGNARTYIYYDPEWEVLIHHDGFSRPLKAIKLTAL
jgi:hypothetical protein